MTTSKINILLIEDEEFDVRRIQKTIQPVANRIQIREIASNGKTAVELLQENPKGYDVVIMDYQIAGGLMGEQLIRKIKAIDPSLQIIVVTKMTINMTDYEFATSLLEAGAMWYCTKYPGDIEDFIYQPTDFILNIFNAYEKRRLERERIKTSRKLQKSVDDLLEKNQIIGRSQAIQVVREQIADLAATEGPVLIQGASGTGKELVAMNIHYKSARRYENFIPINCGSLPENLVESELFGFEKGSFTGASSRKPGLFEIADKGTIFLDEITELSPSAQGTLLRVLQEGEIDKIGRTKKVKVDVRVISASNRNLRRELREGRFREDLFYRLNVFSLYVPPLKERREDIPQLIDHFLALYSRSMNRKPPRIDREAMEYLIEYSWPGNVREIQNVVQRLLFLQDHLLQKPHVQRILGIFPDEFSDQEEQFFNKERILPLREVEKRFRRKYFEFVRDMTRSDADAARLLGLAPPNYFRMCKELGLK